MLSIVVETCTLGIYILATWIAYYNSKYGYNLYKHKILIIGWVIVGGIYIIMLCNVISLLVSLVKLMKQLYNYLKQIL